MSRVSLPLTVGVGLAVLCSALPAHSIPTATQPRSLAVGTPPATLAALQPRGWQAHMPVVATAAVPGPVRVAGSRASACVAELPLDVRIGQTMLVITRSPEPVRASLRSGTVAGVLAAGNLTWTRAAAFRKATAGTRHRAILAADEEGGLVQRYRSVIGRLPSAQWQARNLSPAQVRARYRAHGRELRRWGVGMVLAPVADVGHGPGITTRAYSGDPNVVARYAGAAAAGYRDAGLLPVLKHFPGHGRTSADSHTATSWSPRLRTLRAVDLVPYRTLLRDGRVGVLVAHVQVPGYSGGPSSLSPKVVRGLLRSEYGHRGLVISDGLGMAGTGTTQGRAQVRFLRAGGDLGIVTAGAVPSVRAAVRAALADGSLTKARLNDVAGRVLRHKKLDPCRLLG